MRVSGVNCPGRGGGFIRNFKNSGIEISFVNLTITEQITSSRGGVKLNDAVEPGVAVGPRSKMYQPVRRTDEKLSNFRHGTNAAGT